MPPDEETPENGDAPAVYWQKRIKCLGCGLHYVVCTDYEKWPEKGTTRELKLGEATGLIHCPECGSSSSRKIIYVQKMEGFIFQAVPGDVQGTTYMV